VTSESIVWTLVAGYLVGSIPFAWMIVHGTTGIDLRHAGSGNVGAANALRMTRWRTGVIIALLDLAKGSAAVGLVSLGGGDIAARALGGLAAVAGHIFPLWLRFRGGKGVATACGVFAVLAPFATVVAMLVFTVTAATTRLISLASLAGTGALVTTAWIGSAPRPVALAAAAAAALITWRHQSNILRLSEGTERKIGA
jgi:glycerol-3-phosphate acyltransferase PlsY